MRNGLIGRQQNRLMANGGLLGVVPYSINAIQFATTSDLAFSNAVTVAGSKFFLAAFNIFVPTTWPGTSEVMTLKTSGGAQRIFINTASSGRLNIGLDNSSGVTVGAFTFSTSELAVDTWYGIILSLDTTAGVKRWQAYKRTNGGAWAAITPASSSIVDDGIIDNCGRFYMHDTTPDMYFADVWLTCGETLDLSNSTNRDKFLPSADKGAAGATPTGTSPAVFLSGATGSWVTNKGTGGGLTLTGSIATAPSAPF